MGWYTHYNHLTVCVCPTVEKIDIIVYYRGKLRNVERILIVYNMYLCVNFAPAPAKFSLALGKRLPDPY